MKNAKKILLLVLCAALLVGASVAGTLAYLTSQSSVTNTFTVGNVEITLQEYAVNPQTGDKKTPEETVSGLENLELVPGREIEKNPFITVGAESEDCWLFVKIENNLGDAVTINWPEGTKWTPVEEHDGYYQYTEIVQKGDVIPVFNSVTCDSDKTHTELNGIENKSIEITAYAVQAEGVAQTEAWGALAQHYDELS